MTTETIQIWYNEMRAYNWGDYLDMFLNRLIQPACITAACIKYLFF